MASSKQDQLLRDFDQNFVGLMFLFRARGYLTTHEQLFIENRLLLLQIEYNLWAARLRKATRFPAAKDLTTGTQSSSLRHEQGA
jgi:hypothetical protein